MTHNYPTNPMQILHLSNSPMLKLLVVLKQNTRHDQLGDTHLGLIDMTTSLRVDNIEHTINKNISLWQP